MVSDLCFKTLFEEKRGKRANLSQGSFRTVNTHSRNGAGRADLVTVHSYALLLSAFEIGQGPLCDIFTPIRCANFDPISRDADFDEDALNWTLQASSSFLRTTGAQAFGSRRTER